MPIYEFECAKCKRAFEEFFQSPGQKKKVRCPECGGARVKKMLSLFGVKTSSGKGKGASSSCPSCSSSSCSSCNL